MRGRVAAGVARSERLAMQCECGVVDAWERMTQWW